MLKIRKKMSESSKGIKWINDGIESKMLKGEELKIHLNNGWKYGRTKLKTRKKNG